jgi:FixJ family two-component response regulator
MSDFHSTVFIVDPDRSVRASLETVIHRAGWLTRAFASATDFLACPRLQAPGCLLLEVALPGLNGCDLLRRIAGECTELPTIVMSGEADIPMTVQVMKAGAIEFLMKPLDEQVVLQAIGSGIARSQRLFGHAREQTDLRRRYQSLSSREGEVMTHVVAGLLNKQVGAMLGISEITVKAHRGRMMRKMEADSLPALVGMGIRLGLSIGMGYHIDSRQHQRPIAPTRQFKRLLAV